MSLARGTDTRQSTDKQPAKQANQPADATPQASLEQSLQMVQAGGAGPAKALRPGSIMMLQRTVGNRATRQLLQPDRTPAGDTAATPDPTDLSANPDPLIQRADDSPAMADWLKVTFPGEYEVKVPARYAESSFTARVEGAFSVRSIDLGLPPAEIKKGGSINADGTTKSKKETALKKRLYTWVEKQGKEQVKGVAEKKADDDWEVSEAYLEGSAGEAEETEVDKVKGTKFKAGGHAGIHLVVKFKNGTQLKIGAKAFADMYNASAEVTPLEADVSYPITPKDFQWTPFEGVPLKLAGEAKIGGKAAIKLKPEHVRNIVKDVGESAIKRWLTASATTALNYAAAFAVTMGPVIGVAYLLVGTVLSLQSVGAPAVLGDRAKNEAWSYAHAYQKTMSGYAADVSSEGGRLGKQDADAVIAAAKAEAGEYWDAEEFHKRASRDYGVHQAIAWDKAWPVARQRAFETFDNNFGNWYQVWGFFNKRDRVFLERVLDAHDRHQGEKSLGDRDRQRLEEMREEATKAPPMTRLPQGEPEMIADTSDAMGGLRRHA